MLRNMISITYQRFRFTSQEGKNYIYAEIVDTVGFNMTQTADA